MRREHTIPHSTMKIELHVEQQFAYRVDRVCIVVTALRTQAEAFVLDLGDDQSRYLINKRCIIMEHRLCPLLSVLTFVQQSFKLTKCLS